MESEALMLDWFTSYLTGRKQCIFNGESSELKHNLWGATGFSVTPITFLNLH